MNTLGTMRQDPAAIGQHNTTQTFTDIHRHSQTRRVWDKSAMHLNQFDRESLLTYLM